MYIKQVVLEGFKSYREQVATETLSPKVNCVVGANGYGKLNFFHVSEKDHNKTRLEKGAIWRLKKTIIMRYEKDAIQRLKKTTKRDLKKVRSGV
ncbi:UNVERIFIED_CONTAM: Structural maintenance of chromosomes protein 3 [Sesamum indicum]